MKNLLLLALGAVSVVYAQAPGPARQVYVMPMAGGLDQYLASSIASAHVMGVVTDPKLADVILTDRIGEAFEQKLAEINPPVKKKDEKDSDTRNPLPPRNSFRSAAARGTVFLVDAKSHVVVWSDHERPVEATDRNLNREAARIVKKLAAQPTK